MTYRTVPCEFRRTVFAKRATKAECREIINSLPDAENYLIEYTPVWNAKERWRVIRFDFIPEDTPDTHPWAEQGQGYTNAFGEPDNGWW